MAGYVTRTMAPEVEEAWVREHSAETRCGICGYVERLHETAAWRFIPAMREAHAVANVPPDVSRGASQRREVG